jgi:hypothetical protein
MKRKIVIFRFGSPMPTIGDFEVINQITNGERNAVGMGTPIGSLAIVLTEYTASEIKDLYSEASERHNDSLPVMVIDWASDSAAFDFHPHMFPNFEEMNAEFEESFGGQCEAKAKTIQCTLSLDELLDLVKQKGVKNLSAEELKRLKDLSSNF